MTYGQKIFRNTIFSFGNKIVTILLGFITRKVFIMFLTAELLGLNSLFGDLLGLLNLADMGLAIAVQFNLYKPLADGDNEKVGRILNASKRIYNIIGVAMIVVGAILSFFIQYLIKENPYNLSFLRLVFFLNVISNASTYFYVHKRIFIQVTENLHITNIIDSVMFTVSSILQIVVIVVWGNYVAYVIIGAAQAFLANFMHSVVCDKKYPYLKDIKGYTSDDMKPLLANIKELIPNKISSFIYSNTDSTIISAFLGLTSVALYANYYGISLQLFMMTAMIAAVMKVSFGNMLQSNGDTESQLFYLKAYQLIQFFYAAFCGVALFCLLDDFIEMWYGEKFVAPLAFVVILTLDFFIHCMYQPLSMMVEVFGEFRALKQQEMFCMVLNLLISLALIKPLGIVGPVMGTFIVDIFTTLFRMYTILYKHYRKDMKGFVGKYLLYVFMFVAEYIGTYVLCSLIPLEASWFSFIVKGVICFVITMSINIIVFYRSKEFAYLKDTMLSVVKKG